MNKTKCAHCKDEFERWDDYARHILDKHSDDKSRADWARTALAGPPIEVPPKKIRGHPADRIPPKRLIDYIRRHPSDRQKGSDNKSD